MSLFDQVARQHYASLPEGWQTKKIKFVADIKTSNVDKVAVDGEQPVKLCNYTDVYYRDRITPDIDFMEGTATAKEIERFTLKADQVLITKDSEGWNDIGIPALVAEDMPGVLCGYHLAIFTPDRDKIEGGYLAWLCRADALNDQFKLSANGITRFGLGQYAMKNAIIGFPSLAAQKRIATFLDEKTAQIDALITKKQTLLERLAEKRQAIITQAVTKGLNPAAPMKDSGIEWLGQIPAHWEVKRLKYTGRTRYGLGEPPERDDDGIPFIRATDIFRGSIDLSSVQRVARDTVPWKRKPQLAQGEILIVRSGAYTGDSALVTEKIAGCIAGYDMVFTPEEITSEFIAFGLLAKFMVEGQILIARQRAAQPHLNAEDVGNFLFALPPKPEQQEIGRYLAKTREELDQISNSVKLSLDRLNEYRSTLITSAVTGQIEGLR